MTSRYPLTLEHVISFGAEQYADSQIVTYTDQGPQRSTFAETEQRSGRLANALAKLGVAKGDRVGTFGWNVQEHYETYLAVPRMGAVLHTLNVRLFPEQLTYIVNHAEDKVIVVEGGLVPELAKVAKEFTSVEHYIVFGPDTGADLPGEVTYYEDALGAESADFAWPRLDEDSAAGLCYTSGTTGNPKGVVYTQRCQYTHALGSQGPLQLDDSQRILLVVPLFHANGWGFPYSGWLSGADMLLPGRFTQPEPLTGFITSEGATLAAAVPTVWNDILRYADGSEVDLSSIQKIICGGAAVPLSLMKAYQEKFGVKLIQAWGMTETGPLAALAFPPKGTAPEDEWKWRAKTGRIIPGVDIRIAADDGEILPRDGEAVGEIEVKGPWVIDSYYKVDAEEKFHDGWLRTGDVGTLDAKGFIQITDRAKDVIKSGGEWISSVEIEGLLMGHPAVAEAAVVGVPDERWTERPLACVVLSGDSHASPDELRDYLSDKIVKWWMPERWAYIDEVPKTSVGKFDKKVLRARYSEGKLELAAGEGPGRRQ